MNFKTTYVLFAVLVGVLGVFLLTQIFGKRSAGEGKTYVLASFHDPVEPVKTDQIGTVTIERHGKDDPAKTETLTFVRSDKAWRLSAPNVRCQDFMVDRLVDQVSGARKEENVDLTSNLSQYGLDNPRTTVTLATKNGDRKWELRLGNESIGGDRGVVYVTSSDFPKEPMAVKRSELDNLFKEKNDFRSKDLLGGSGLASFSQVDYVKLQKGDKEVVLKKAGDGHWRFEKPDYGDADYEASGSTESKAITAVKGLISAAENIRVDANEDFLGDDADPAKYGLGSKADLRITLNRRESAEKSEVAQVLLIGSKVEAKGEKKPAEKSKEMYYARLDDEQAVVKVNADLVKPILDFIDKPDVVRNKDLVQVDEAKVDAVDIKNKHGLLKLRRTEPANWKLFTGADKQGQKADHQVVMDLIKALDEKGQVKSFPDSAQEANLGFSKPDAVTVSLWVDGLKKEEKAEEKKEDKKDEKKEDKKDEKKDDKKDEKKEAKKEEKKPADEEPKLKDDKPAVKLVFGNTDKGLVNVLRVKDGDKRILAVPEKILSQIDQGELAFLDRTIPSFSESADVTKLVIQRGGETYEIDKEVSAATPTWKIKKPANLEGRTADSFKVEDIIKDLRGMRPTKLVAKKAAEADLKKYGLEPPLFKAVVTIMEDKKPKEWTYLFGGDSDDATRYAKQGDRDLVFAVKSDVLKNLQSDLPNLKIFTFDSAKVKEIKLVGWKKVEKRTITLALERKAGSTTAWQIKNKNELGDFELNDTPVNELASELSRLTAERFVVFKQGPKPEFELGANERALQIELVVEGEKAPLALTIGKLDAEKKAYYAEASNLKGDVFLIPQDRLEKVVTGGLKHFSK